MPRYRVRHEDQVHYRDYEAPSISAATLKFAVDAGMPERFFAAVAEWDGAQWGAPTTMLVNRPADQQLHVEIREVVEIDRGGEESVTISHTEAQAVADAVQGYRNWFYKTFYIPISGALSGGVMPTVVMATLKTLDSFQSEAQVAARASRDLVVPPQRKGLLKRAILVQRKVIAEEQDRLRAETHDADLRTQIESMVAPYDQLAAAPWFTETDPAPLPRITDFISLRGARKFSAQPRKVRLLYDEKFGVLQSPTSFLPRLALSRSEASLRDCPVSVAFIDIDKFKDFNTRLTESIVDRDVLPMFMRALEGHVYSHGHAYRLGGDEYLCLLPNTDLRLAAEFMRRFQQKIRTMDYGGRGTITVSIGICTVGPESSLTDHQIQERANKAKEFAKAQGRDRIASYRGSLYRDQDLALF